MSFCEYTSESSTNWLLSKLLISSPVTMRVVTIDSFPIVRSEMLTLRPFMFSWFISDSVAKVAELPGSKNAYVVTVFVPFCDLMHTGTIERTQSSLPAPVTPNVSAVCTRALDTDCCSQLSFAISSLESLLVKCNGVGCGLEHSSH